MSRLIVLHVHTYFIEVATAESEMDFKESDLGHGEGIESAVAFDVPTLTSSPKNDNEQTTVWQQ